MPLALRPWLQERQYADAYHWSYRGNNLATYQLRTAVVRDLLARTAGASGAGARPSLLDVGCGDGRFLADVSDRFQAHGVDCSNRALDHARRLVPSATCTLGGAERLPFPDGRFDVVTLLDVVEHLSDERERAALAEARRVLRPGGRLVISTNTDRSAVEWKHYRHYAPARFRALFAGLDGFEAVGLIPYFPTLRLLMALPLVGDRLRDRVRTCPPDEGQIVVGVARKG